MSSASSYDPLPAIQAALVVAVKEVEKAHDFGKDVWFDFCHNKAPKNDRYQSVSRDPATYSVGFLGDFLQHVSKVCKDEDSIREFSTRKYRKVDRGPGFGGLAAVKEVDRLWIVVGESVLSGASGLAVQHREVALVSDYVYHSGVAVAMLLGCLGSGIVQQRLRIRLSDSYTIGCIHFEGGLWQFPRTSDQGAYHGRLDNLNNVLRAFGVDAKATRSSLGRAVRSNLHPKLTHFVGVGAGSYGDLPCFHISPDRFLNVLSSRGTKALHDGLLVKMLHDARTGVNNGIEAWYAPRDRCVLSDVLRYYGEDRPSTLCLVLSPEGVPLQPSPACEARALDDIFAD